MKAGLPLALLITLAALAPARAQTDADFWTFQPRLSIGKLLPGSPIEQEQSRYYPAVDFIFIPSAPSIRYQGTTLDINVRAFPAGVSWIALTLGGGVTWFSRTDHAHDDPVLLADKGIGEQLAPGDFVAFPLSAGIQLVYPETGRSDFLLFAGLHGSANFISGDIPMDQQIKGGFGFSAGFAVKVFELGLRYESFSDMRNLGVYLGFRLNPFEMRPPDENPE